MSSRFRTGRDSHGRKCYCRFIDYRRIRSKFDHRLIVEYETGSEMCEGMRLYYTDFIKIHVCPYLIITDTNINRMARVFVHELTHMALLVADRTYYDPKSYSSRYAELTPRGHWTAQIPLIGLIFREIARSDTLYQPDGYSHFAAKVL